MSDPYPSPFVPPATLTQGDLAARWQLTIRTLDRWRIAGTGPAWMLLNGSIRYRMEDVLAFEQARLRGVPRRDADDIWD